MHLKGFFKNANAYLFTTHRTYWFSLCNNLTSLIVVLSLCIKTIPLCYNYLY